jgi:hypothetical protein
MGKLSRFSDSIESGNWKIVSWFDSVFLNFLAMLCDDFGQYDASLALYLKVIAGFINPLIHHFFNGRSPVFYYCVFVFA